MAHFNKRKSHAERMQDRAARLDIAGRRDLIKPMEAYRVAHHRPDDAWRQVGKHKGPNATPWKGAKGKQKKQQFPK